MKQLIAITVFTLIAFNLKAQKKIFIEPFVSFSYDETKLELETELYYGAYEDCSFKSTDKEGDAFSLYINPDPLRNRPTDREINRRIKTNVERYKGYEGDSIAVVYIDQIEINGFVGTVMISKNKLRSNEQTITIRLTKVVEGGMIVVIMVEETNENKFNKKSRHWQTINEIVGNIEIHDQSSLNAIKDELVSNIEIEIEDLPLKNLYKYGTRENEEDEWTMHETYDKDSVPFDIKPSRLHHTYRGKIILNPEIKHTVKEIRVKNENGSLRIINIEEGEDLIFTAKDKEKGLIKKRGILILLSEVGHEIEIPFEFEYTNE